MNSRVDQPTLSDSFGRRFHYLRLSITDVCNFRCTYCLPDGYQKHDNTDPLTLSEIETLVRAFARLGTQKIRITGGEPAVRKDLTDIIGLCKGVDGIDRVALTTNGYNLAQNVDQWRAAGLDALNVSLDSLDKVQFERITGTKMYDKVMQGLDRALTHSFDAIKVNAVLLKQFNHDQLNAFLAWVKTTAVAVRFIELMQTGDNRVFFSQNHISGFQIIEQLQAQGWLENEKSITAGPAREFSHRDYAGKIGLIMPYSKDFCATCNRLRVSSLGKLHLCLFSEQGISLRDALTRGDVDAVVELVQQAISGKLPSHLLQHGNTGSTRHLAMLGG